MRKLIESTFITLDGVISSPQKWGSAFWNDEHAQYARQLLFASDTLLLGRETYEGFARVWPTRTGDEYSDRINAMAKYVASRTLKETTWNTKLLEGNAADAVAALKKLPGQSLLKFGTGELDRTLVEHKLVDEFHLWLFPVAVGSGQRIFDGFGHTNLTLVNTTKFSTGIVVLTYVPASPRA